MKISLSKMGQTIVVSISIFALAVFIGCASVQEAVIPCYIPPPLLNYANTKSTTFLPFTTLWDAKRVGRKAEFVHLRNRMLDDLQYNFLKGLNSFHIEAAQELKTTIFSPTGPIGLLFPTIVGGGLGTFLLSKPSDKKKIKELEEKVINGKSNQ